MMHLALLLIALLAEERLRFPDKGTPYPQAKAALLMQGFKLAPMKPAKHHPHYREVDCGLPGGRCRAAFLFRRPDGWRDYALIRMAADADTIENAEFAYPADGLLSVPPPIPAGIPVKAGTLYLDLRDRLRALGYRPLRVGMPDHTCADEACTKWQTIPEAECAGDVPVCSNYWEAPGGRMLIVMTRGERLRDRRASYASWATPEERRTYRRSLHH